jgi:hypothetical protein
LDAGRRSALAADCVSDVALDGRGPDRGCVLRGCAIPETDAGPTSGEGLAVAVVQDRHVALVRAYGPRDVEAGLKVTLAASGNEARSRRYHEAANLLTKGL